VFWSKGLAGLLRAKEVGGRRNFLGAGEVSGVNPAKTPNAAEGVCRSQNAFSLYESALGCGKKPVFLYKTLVLSTIYVIMASYLA
jgi:hypothetical protein